MSDAAQSPTRPQSAPGRRRKFTVDALFTDHRPQAVGVVDLPTAKEIRLDRIEPDPDQPRRTFDPDRLAELAASIQLEGVLQPIVVRYDTARDVYIIVHGERRWRACRAANLASIPAIVREIPADRRLVQQLMENIVRDDLNAVDRAAALRALKRQLADAPWEQVAEAVGIRRSRLFQLLGTEKLPEAARDDIRSGRLSEKQSRALQGLPPVQQEALREVMLEENLPADEAMRLARQLRTAELPDDAAAVTQAIHDFRQPAAPPVPTPRSEAPPSAAPAELMTLLSALTEAASGNRQARAQLDRLSGPPRGSYDLATLQAQVLTLAQLLARAPAAALRPGGDAYATLAALAGTLDALLSA